MKKVIYNISLVVLYFLAATFVSSEIFSIWFIHGDKSLGRHIVLLICAIVLFVLHYFVLIWGRNKKLLHKASAVVLCVIDIYLFHYCIIYTAVFLLHVLMKKYPLFEDPNRIVANAKTTITLVISLLVPILRIIFTAIIFAKRGKTGDGSETGDGSVSSD